MMGNEYSLQLEDERQTNASRAAQRHLPVIRVKPDPNVCKGVCVLSFYCVAVGAVMVQSSFLSYKIIQTYMTDSKGITNYNMSLAKCIVLSFFCIGFALVGAVCLTFFLGFLCCWDANRKPRKQWFLLFPILCLVLIPGVLLRNECQGKLEWFEGFDYYGDMLVLACGGHYHEYATCATHAMSSCATTKGEFVVTWNTTNTTTGMPLTCKSLVWQPSCEKDICMYDSDVKKDYRCPYANDEAAINQSLAETTQCMLDRYQSTTFPVQCDWMAESHIFIELYGNSKTCEATIPPEHEEPKFFKNMYKRGDIMVTSSWVVLGLIFVGSFVEYFYLKDLAAVQAADSAEAHEASATLEMAPSFDFSADDFSAEIHPVETANCNDEVKDLPRIV